MTHHDWKDAKRFKPMPGSEVMLFRTYRPGLELTYTGFRSFGYWDGHHWHDARYEGIIDNDSVKYFHELPPLPAGETERIES